MKYSFQSALAGYKSRPEHELLLLLARSELEPDLRGRVLELCGQALDWQHLLRWASFDRIMPLVAHHLLDLKPPSVPAGFLDPLRTLAWDHARSALVQSDELLRVLQRMEEAGLPALPFKGPVLSDLLYGDVSMRQFTDLDILVRPSDAAKGRSLLLSCGYRPRHIQEGPRGRAALRPQCHYQLVRDDPRVGVELHWRVLPRALGDGLDPAHLVERAGWTSLGGVQVRMFRRQDLPPVLAAHCSKHLCNCVQWIADLAELSKGMEEDDWAESLAVAERAGVRRMLLLCLFLSHELLATRLPERILESARADPLVPSLACEVVARRLAGGAGSVKRERIWFYLRVLQSGPQRLFFLLRTAQLLATPTVREWDRVPLADVWFFLYYPIRAARLLIKWSRRSWTRLRAFCLQPETLK